METVSQDLIKLQKESEKKNTLIKNLEKTNQKLKESDNDLKIKLQYLEDNFQDLLYKKQKLVNQLAEKSQEAANYECELITLKEEYKVLYERLNLIRDEKNKEQMFKSDNFTPFNLQDSNIVNTTSFDIATSPTDKNPSSYNHNLQNELKEIGGSLTSIDFINLKSLEEKKEDKNSEANKLLIEKLEEYEEYKRNTDKKLKDLISQNEEKQNVINYFEF